MSKSENSNLSPLKGPPSDDQEVVSMVMNEVFSDVFIRVETSLVGVPVPTEAGGSSDRLGRTEKRLSGPKKKNLR